MPIPIEKLKEKQRPLEDRILEFLGKDRSKAYSAFEIVAAIEGYADENGAILAIALGTEEQRDQVLRPVLTALIVLAKRGVVSQGVHQGIAYYGLVDSGR